MHPIDILDIYRGKILDRAYSQMENHNNNNNKDDSNLFDENWGILNRRGCSTWFPSWSPNNRTGKNRDGFYPRKKLRRL